MRPHFKKTVFLAAGVAVWLLAAAVLARAQTTIRLGTLAPTGTSYHQSLLGMREKWRQAPGGPVNLIIYADGTMGSQTDMVARMRIGQLQAAMLTGFGLAEIDDSINAIQAIPMMYRSLEEMEYAREKLRPVLEKKLFEKGYITLFWGDAGWVRYFSKNPVLRPGDLKKTKLFLWAPDAHTVEAMKRLGFNPVPLESSDMLPGLQTGMINALSTMPFFALAGQFYKHVPHMLDLNWAPVLGATVVTRKAWESLQEPSRAHLLKAAAEAGAQIKAAGRAENVQAVEAMKKRGLTVHPVTVELEAEWRKYAEEVIYPNVVRGHIVRPDLFDDVQRVVREYRAQGGK